MRLERMAGLVRRWATVYTRGLPGPVARRRVAEIKADLHEHIIYGRASPLPSSRPPGQKGTAGQPEPGGGAMGGVRGVNAPCIIAVR